MHNMQQAPSAEPTDTRSEQYTLRGDPMVARTLMKRRADEAAKFLLPFLQPGMRLLDCGCGPGAITLGLSEVVAPGEVVGVDQDIDQTQSVQEQAKQNNLQNLHFKRGNVYELPFPDDTFDAVFSNALFCHLQSPERALQEIRRVLKPTGLLGLRDTDLDGLLYAPANPLIDKYWQLYIDLIKHNGGNLCVGKELPALLHQAGFTRMNVSTSFETTATPERVRRFENFGKTLWQGSVGQPLINLGWVNSTEQMLITEAFTEFSQSPGAFIAQPWIEVVAWPT